MTTTIAFIPARRDSKRLPGKNTRLLFGKPLVQYSIEHAFSAETIDHVVVSTNDDKVKDIAHSFDCHIIQRGEELSNDSATTLEVIKQGLSFLNTIAVNPIYLVLLQPTVPIRDPKKIDETVSILTSTGCDSVISHIPVDYFHPNRMKKIVDARVTPYCEPEIENVPRKELPLAYYRDGSIYGMKSELPLLKNTLYGNDVRAVINDPQTFVNIDEERDWAIAEWILGSKLSKMKV